MDNKINKTKITHVTRYAYPHIGGIEAVINQINESLSESKFEKEVLCCSNTEKSSIENSVKYNRCKFLFEFAANTISPKLILELSKVKTDILHYHMPFIFAVIAHFIARPKYKKLYISYHGGIVGYDKYMWLFWGLYRKFYKLADKIHVLSPTIIDTDIVLSDNKDKCEIVPYGIDTEVSVNKEDIEQLRKKYDNKKIILCVGRLVKFKGFSHIIEAMKKVENAVLLIAGDGPLRSEFEAYIDENGLQEKVKLLGSVVEPQQKNILFAACDVFILSSIRTSESFGIVQLEAMRYSKPVVNTNLGTGVNYVSVHKETGLTVSIANADELSNAINVLLSDDKIRIEYGQNAKKRMVELFDINKIKDKYVEMYKDVN